MLWQIKKYYDRRYTSSGDRAFRPPEAYPVFLKWLNVKPGHRLLDVGCGNGFLLDSAMHQSLKAYAVDISEAAVRLAHENAKGAHIVMGIMEKLPWKDNLFHYLSCIGTLLHATDMDKALSEFHRVTTDDAMLCILVPNRRYVFWKRQFGRIGTIPQQEIKEELHTLEEWRHLLRTHGFLIKCIHQDKWFSGSVPVLVTANPIRLIRGVVWKLAWLFMPLRYTYQFGFICTKR